MAAAKAVTLDCQPAVLLGVPMAELTEKQMAAMWVAQKVVRTAAYLDLKTAVEWENLSVATKVARKGHMSVDSKDELRAASLA